MMPSFRSRVSAGQSRALALAPALLLTILVYARALGTFFAQDDISFLSRAAGLEPPSPLFRPLSAGLAFRIEYAAFGLEPFGYHVVNLALHLLVVAGVFRLGAKLMGSRAAGGAAALLFGVSSIGFTPLHWATGVSELLAGALVVAATLLHLESDRRGSAWRWCAAGVALAAMFAKETAIAWVIVIAIAQSRRGPFSTWVRRTLPAAIASIVFAAFLSLSDQAQRFWTSASYIRSGSPLHLVRNLCTYVRWSAVINEPIRDLLALPDPNAWRIALPIAGLIASLLWWRRAQISCAVALGISWWLAFLLPVLPLTHHSYLYYLYLPWIGGSIAVAALGRSLLAGVPRPWARIVVFAALAAYAFNEAHNVSMRETATRDALPVDRTMRDAELLRHALTGLRAARLPRGARIAFVNPAPRPHFDLMTGAPTRAEDAKRRASYWPLEAAMRGGETVRLFLPHVAYLGFAKRIPPDWEDAECFFFEQRGWLQDWGRGHDALLHQADIQRNAGDSAAAESTMRRVRVLRDPGGSEPGPPLR